MVGQSFIRVVGARQHNLQDITVEIPRGKVTVITGVSGSGKSSLAFDTIYAEGQRRYVESMSVHARQLLEQLEKPNVDRIEGLSPTIAVEQRAAQAGPRATVATSTEIYDYLRVLFARTGQPYCQECNRPIVQQPVSRIVSELLERPEGSRVLILAPLVAESHGTQRSLLDRLRKQGFVRVRINGEVILLDDAGEFPADRRHTVEAVADRLVIKPGIGPRAAESIELAAHLSSGRFIISEESTPGVWTDQTYSTRLTCPDHPQMRIDELSPRLFSFNSPQGACPECLGLGCTMEFDADLVVPDRQRSLQDGAVAAWRHHGPRLQVEYAKLTAEFARAFRASADQPLREWPEATIRRLLHGTTEEGESGRGVRFEGVLPNLRRLWNDTRSQAVKERLHPYLAESPCPACHGARLRPEALSVRVFDHGIADVTRMSITEAGRFFDRLAFTGESAVVAEPVVRDLRQRLTFLREVGVDYLTLDRATASLSSGEWQRLRLATQIGSGLSGVCYVLDEPTVGLHPRDSRRLADLLRGLADLDNTVIVVEHDSEVIAAADYLIDIGPGAGAQGGRVIAQGTPREVMRNRESLTGRFLSGVQSIPVPTIRRSIDCVPMLTLRDVTAHNLKNVTVRFPLGRLVCVTGVSGSGKSTLVSQVLVRALRRRLAQSGPRPGPCGALDGADLVDQIVDIGASPLGRSARGNPATYAGLLALIRELFARTREAKVRGYTAARFSFNNQAGRCTHCAGRGTKRIIMHFLPDVFVLCGECGGKRYNPETLEIRYRGKSMADVLDMRVDEALTFFDNFSNIKRRLQLLEEVGLGYIALGQSMNTLSGGEAQRLKLAAELQRGGEGRTLYVLDEPTTGLHFADVGRLLTILHRLVDRGHSVLCVEHHLDVIKCADWVIDLGPEGGDAGGHIVAEGTPETVAAAGSHTGQYLRKVLKVGSAANPPSSSPENRREETRRKIRPKQNRKP